MNLHLQIIYIGPVIKILLPKLEFFFFFDRNCDFQLIIYLVIQGVKKVPDRFLNLM